MTSAILPLPALPGDLQTEVGFTLFQNFASNKWFQVLQAILTLSCHPCWIVSGQVSFHIFHNLWNIFPLLYLSLSLQVCLSLVTLCQELSQVIEADKITKHHFFRLPWFLFLNFVKKFSRMNILRRVLPVQEQQLKTLQSTPWQLSAGDHHSSAYDARKDWP